MLAKGEKVTYYISTKNTYLQSNQCFKDQIFFKSSTLTNLNE